MITHRRLKIFAVLLLICGFGLAAFAQSNTFNAATYGAWVSYMNPGNVVLPVTVTAANGVQFIPFQANEVITVDKGLSTAETLTVTPSNCYTSSLNCTLGGTYTYLHGVGSVVTSGTYGLQEAINQALLAPPSGTVLIDSHWGGPSGSSLITAAKGAVSVVIQDNRSGTPQYYQWSGSAYVLVSALSGVSLSSPNGTLNTSTGSTANPTADINLGHANTWTGTQNFNAISVTGGCTGCMSLPLAGAGAAIVTGPSTSVSGDLLTYTGTAGQTQDSGTALSALAPLASPALTGTPTAPTQAISTNNTDIATTAAVTTALGGYATSGANSNITSLTGLTTPLSVLQGGTGSQRSTILLSGVTTPATYSGTSSQTKTLSSSLPSAGFYQACAYISVTVAATAGTFQPALTFTADTNTYSGLDMYSGGAVSATTQYNQEGACQQFYADASSAVSIQLKLTSVTGTPTFRYVFTLYQLD